MTEINLMREEKEDDVYAYVEWGPHMSRLRQFVRIRHCGLDALLLRQVAVKRGSHKSRIKENIPIGLKLEAGCHFVNLFKYSQELSREYCKTGSFVVLSGASDSVGVFIKCLNLLGAKL